MTTKNDNDYDHKVFTPKVRDQDITSVEATAAPLLKNGGMVWPMIPKAIRAHRSQSLLFHNFNFAASVALE